MRRFARELGVDLARVTGRRPKGRIRRTTSERRPSGERGGRRRGSRRRRAGLRPRPVAEGRFRAIRTGRGSPLSRIQRISGAELRAQLDDDPARHPERRGRHHRARGVAQALNESRREGGVKFTWSPSSSPRVSPRCKRVPGVQRVARRRRTGAAAVLQHRLRRRHPERPRRAGDQGCRQKGVPRSRASSTTLSGGRAPASWPADMQGGTLHDLVARRDRRDVVHADHQRAGGGDPRASRRAGDRPVSAVVPSRRGWW